MLDRIFTKKTRRGNILKIVREHYLRDDLSCGSEATPTSCCTRWTCWRRRCSRTSWSRRPCCRSAGRAASRATSDSVSCSTRRPGASFALSMSSTSEWGSGRCHGFEKRFLVEFCEGSMRLTHKKTVFSHKLSIHFFEAVNYHTKITKKTKQSAFHTDLVN